MTNPDDDPVPTYDVDNPAFQPFQHTATCEIAAEVCCCQNVIGVPDGKRLIIEFITVNFTVPVDQFGAASISTTAGGTVSIHQIPLSGPIGNKFQTAQTVRLYADGGSNVLFTGVRAGAVPLLGMGNFVTSISGYFVDVP